jgi:alkyl sulfatase BDS1-like metallo-beta-lactamase superfamily hydrolase
MLLDFAAVRINPNKAAERAFKINIELTDRREKHLISVENGVMIHEAGIVDPAAGATVKMKRPDLLMTLLAGIPVGPRIESGDVVVAGDARLYDALVGMIEPLTPNFPIVTP